MEQEGTVELLSELVLHSDEEVKLNGLWAMMNMTYKANAQLRSKILAHVSSPFSGWLLGCLIP